jgi:hypothetical protein
VGVGTISIAHALPVLSRVAVAAVTTTRGPTLLEVDANLTAIDAADLAAPADLPTLRSLNLYGTSLDSTAVRGLGRLENLQWLSIGGTRLREAHAVIDRHQVKDPTRFNLASAARKGGV